MIYFHITFMLIVTSIMVILWQNITTSYCYTTLDYDEFARVAIRTFAQKKILDLEAMSVTWNERKIFEDILDLANKQQEHFGDFKFDL